MSEVSVIARDLQLDQRVIGRVVVLSFLEGLENLESFFEIEDELRFEGKEFPLV